MTRYLVHVRNVWVLNPELQKHFKVLEVILDNIKMHLDGIGYEVVVVVEILPGTICV